MATTKKSVAPLKKQALSKVKSAAPANKAVTPFKKTVLPVKKAAAKKAVAKHVPAKQTSEQLLEAFFCEELKDIYWAEKHLLKVLPKMAKNATSPKL